MAHAGARWVSLIFLAGAAFVTLPRMFQVLVVENEDDRQLATAAWAFPLYMFVMSAFVVPIAVVGLATAPEGANPDLFVLTLPLAAGKEGLATLAFIGGFSSATSMVIVAAIALSTMVSNHIVVPLWLWGRTRRDRAMISGDVRNLVLISRRLSIIAILGLGLLYYRFSGGGEALASIGLISFAGVAQVLPALVGGLFWRGATRGGAAAGLIAGFAVWAYTLYLPSFGESGVIGPGVLAEGPWGIGWLRPQALFGTEGLDPLVHALFFSLAVNIFTFLTVSLFTFPTPLERLQSAQFVLAGEQGRTPKGWSQGAGGAEDLLVMAQRLMGPSEAQALFRAEAAAQGKEGYLPDATPAFIERLERELAGSVGAATAHAMIGQIVGGAAVSVGDLMAVADETQQMLEYSSRLEAQSEELSRTARQLSAANEKLTRLSIQKDSFLSQISHELRTPMTSIRAFSELMLESDETLSPEERHRYSRIIQDEAIRLTRLLDDLLDLSVLEAGRVTLNLQDCRLGEVMERALTAAGADKSGGGIEVRLAPGLAPIEMHTDGERLTQVFINLISNAMKYCDAQHPVLSISGGVTDGMVIVDFIDNGSGIPAEKQDLIFEKFSRLTDEERAGGAGLGLAICREIMDKLGGALAYLPGQGGAGFRVTLPVRAELSTTG